MAGPVRARLLGDDYQHRFFWIEACRLYTNAQNVTRVGIEVPLLRAFDDVVTTYRSPLVDAHGRAHVIADHYQLKFHLRRGQRIHGADLVDPAFIGASKVSLLERAHAAVVGPDGDGRRLALITPWDVDLEDPLARLIERDGALDLDELFTGGPRAAMTRLREAWRDRLGGVDDTTLREVASRLWFWPNKQSHDLDRLLDSSLAGAGLEPVDYAVRIHRYVALSGRFIADDTREHDADALDAILTMERLRTVPIAMAGGDGTIGVKSFERFSQRLEDEADVVNLVPSFHGRYLQTSFDWDRDIVPQLARFLDARVASGRRYDLFLDCHLSIAYLTGYLLGKVDAEVAPVDRRTRTAWRGTAAVGGPETLDWREIRTGDGPALAIAVEVTRAAADDVVLYATENDPSIGRVLVLTVKGGPAQTSVRDADHAATLAADVTTLLERQRSTDERRRPLHVFVAAPVQVAYLLGVEGRAYGPTVTYEYDFTTRAPGAYSPSFHLPPKEA